MAMDGMIGKKIKFEDWKGDTRTGEVVSILKNGDYEVSTDRGMALVKNAEIIKMRKGGYVPKSVQMKREKVAKVMHEFKEGKLHSGSKNGPIVKDRDQAIAIALAEANSKKMAKGGEMGWKHKMAKGGGVEQYQESKHLTQEQWEKWNEYVKTGKIDGKKENNIFAVARWVGAPVAHINAYEMEQRRKRLPMAKGGGIDKTEKMGKIKISDIVSGAKFKAKSGTVFIVDSTDGKIVESSLEGGAKGNYRDPIGEFVAFMNEMGATKIMLTGGSMYVDGGAADGGGNNNKSYLSNPSFRSELKAFEENPEKVTTTIAIDNKKRNIVEIRSYDKTSDKEAIKSLVTSMIYNGVPGKSYSSPKELLEAHRYIVLNSKNNFDEFMQMYTELENVLNSENYQKKSRIIELYEDRIWAKSELYSPSRTKYYDTFKKGLSIDEIERLNKSMYAGGGGSLDILNQRKELLQELLDSDIIDEDHGYYADVRDAIQSNDSEKMREMIDELLSSGFIYKDDWDYKLARKLSKTNKMSDGGSMYEGGGALSSFNPKSFTLDELKDYLWENDIWFSWFQKGWSGITPASQIENLWDGTSHSLVLKKWKDKKLTISDYGHLEIEKGSENLYLDLIVYELDGSDDPYTIRIYTKENHKGLKEFANHIIDKFKKGGAADGGAYRTGEKVMVRVRGNEWESGDIVRFDPKSGSYVVYLKGKYESQFFDPMDIKKTMPTHPYEKWTKEFTQKWHSGGREIALEKYKKELRYPEDDGTAWELALEDFIVEKEESGRMSKGGSTYADGASIHSESELNRRFEMAKSEILTDVKSGDVPKTIKSFADLHEYVDANCYGGLCDDDYEISDDYSFENKLHDKLDAWIKQGGLKGRKPSKMSKGGAADGGSMYADIVGEFFYDSRKDKAFQVIFEDGSKMGIQYLGSNKKPVGVVETINKNEFDYNTKMGVWAKWKQAFSKGGSMGWKHKMTRGGGVGSFKSEQITKLKAWKKEKISDLNDKAKSLGITNTHSSYLKAMEKLDKLVDSVTKILKSKLLQNGKYMVWYDFKIKSYQSSLMVDAEIRLDKSLVMDQKKYQDEWVALKEKYPYGAVKDNFIAGVIGKITEPILGYTLCREGSYAFTPNSVGGAI